MTQDLKSLDDIPDPLPRVTLYSDGACVRSQSGRGAAATILTCKKPKYHEKQIVNVYELTTNNRMEMRAVIQGLEALKKRSFVHVFSDSKYVVSAFNEGWIKNWKRNGWTNSKGKPVANQNLWDPLIALVDQHVITFQWVKAHKEGNRDKHHKKNDAVDALAYQAFRDRHMPVNEDEGFKDTKKPKPKQRSFLSKLWS